MGRPIYRVVSHQAADGEVIRVERRTRYGNHSVVKRAARPVRWSAVAIEGQIMTALPDAPYRAPAPSGELTGGGA